MQPVLDKITQANINVVLCAVRRCSISCLYDYPRLSVHQPVICTLLHPHHAYLRNTASKFLSLGKAVGSGTAWHRRKTQTQNNARLSKFRPSGPTTLIADAVPCDLLEAIRYGQVA